MRSFIACHIPDRRTHVQIWFDQILPLALSTGDLGMRFWTRKPAHLSWAVIHLKKTVVSPETHTAINLWVQNPRLWVPEKGWGSCALVHNNYHCRNLDIFSEQNYLRMAKFLQTILALYRQRCRKTSSLSASHLLIEAHRSSHLLMYKPWHWAPVLILLDFLACVQVVIYAITIFLLHQSWLLPIWLFVQTLHF